MRRPFRNLTMGAVVVAMMGALLGMGFQAVSLPAMESLVASPEGSPSASPSASPGASPVGTMVAVSIVDFGFDAPKLEVPVGTTVTWTNTGKVIHTTTSKDKLWDSAIMNPGDTFSYTFTEAGTFDYWCTLHPNMLGTIVVTP